MLKKHNIPTFFLALFLLQTLTACTGEKQATNQKTVHPQDTSQTDTEEQLNHNTAQTQDNLQIASKCIGCNRCIMIDAEHFASKIGNRIPEVISQKNLDSAKLQTAIQNCPVGAISLSENINHITN